jgi:hypothetical protein
MLGDGHVKPYINISKIIPKLEFHTSGKTVGQKKQSFPIIIKKSYNLLNYFNI